MDSPWGRDYGGCADPTRKAGNGNQTDETTTADQRSEQDAATAATADEEVEDLEVTDDEADDVQGGGKHLGQDMDPY